MSAKDIIIDFLNYLFLILVSVFMLFYVVLGDRMAYFAAILNILMVFSVFAFIFLIILKIRRRQIKKYIKEDNLHEIVADLSPLDLLIDRFFTIAAFAAVIAISFVDGNFNALDFFQAFIPTGLFFGWHLFLFKNGLKINKSISLSKLDKIKDEIFVLSMPMVLLSLAILSGKSNSVDSLQAIVLFIILFSGHLKIFKR